MTCFSVDRPSAAQARRVAVRSLHSLSTRARDETEAEEAIEEPNTLHRLRNTWQFANITQYLGPFGDAVP